MPAILKHVEVQQAQEGMVLDKLVAEVTVGMAVLVFGALGVSVRFLVVVVPKLELMVVVIPKPVLVTPRLVTPGHVITMVFVMALKLANFVLPKDVAQYLIPPVTGGRLGAVTFTPRLHLVSSSAPLSQMIPPASVRAVFPSW